MLTSLQLQQTIQLCLSEYERVGAYGKPIIFHVRRVVQRAIAKDYNNEIIALCWLHDYYKFCTNYSEMRQYLADVNDIDKQLARDLTILTPQSYNSLRAYLKAVSDSTYPRIVKAFCLADELFDMPPSEDRKIYFEYFEKFINRMDGYTINQPPGMPLLGHSVTQTT